MHRVQVAGRDIAFACAGDETVLDAAERAGYLMPCSCRRGVCGTCEGRLLAGEVHIAGHRRAGSGEPVLLCQARPRSDIAIAAKRVERRSPPARRTLEASVLRIGRPARDVSVLLLRFSIGVRAPFLSGQYLQIVMRDGERRSYSMANPAHANDGVELHIRHMPAGRFSGALLAGLGRGDPLTVELPFGQFFLRTSEAPAILLATGTGFAPIKSMVEHAWRRGDRRPMHLYWGGRSADDLYMLERVSKWTQRAPWFTCVPVLSRAGAPWRGRTGHVQRAALEDHPDMAGMEVYACGNPLMVAAAAAELVEQAGLPAAHFYADAFVAAG
jgi:CDP-4-dehydro-6-deoxyglucose reductase/3-phenylpropionate/trans-cinnamate dioxygenase ferredoxin reductase subunit